MKASDQASVLSAAPDLYYAVDKDFTLVVKEGSGEAFRLAGMEQVVWDCLNLGYTREQLETTLAASGKLGPEAARSTLEAILQEWQTLGLVQVEARKGG